jgi:glycopeptide antibiotics resistance protein
MRVLALPLIVVTLLVFTLRPGDIAPGDAYAINLEPFRDLRTSLQSGSLVDVAILNLVGNAAMFVPFGVVVAWVLPGARGFALLMAAFAFSMAIEIAQTVLNVGRSSDSTDAIMGTVGATLGFVVWRSATRRSRDRAHTDHVQRAEGNQRVSPGEPTGEIRGVPPDYLP